MNNQLITGFRAFLLPILGDYLIDYLSVEISVNDFLFGFFFSFSEFASYLITEFREFKVPIPGNFYYRFVFFWWTSVTDFRKY